MKLVINQSSVVTVIGEELSFSGSSDNTVQLAETTTARKRVSKHAIVYCSGQQEYGLAEAALHFVCFNHQLQTFSPFVTGSTILYNNNTVTFVMK